MDSNIRSFAGTEYKCPFEFIDQGRAESYFIEYHDESFTGFRDAEFKHKIQNMDSEPMLKSFSRLMSSMPINEREKLRDYLVLHANDCKGWNFKEVVQDCFLDESSSPLNTHLTCRLPVGTLIESTRKIIDNESNQELQQLLQILLGSDDTEYSMLMLKATLAQHMGKLAVRRCISQIRPYLPPIDPEIIRQRFKDSSAFISYWENGKDQIDKKSLAWKNNKKWRDTVKRKRRRQERRAAEVAAGPNSPVTSDSEFETGNLRQLGLKDSTASSSSTKNPRQLMVIDSTASSSTTPPGEIAIQNSSNTMPSTPDLALAPIISDYNTPSSNFNLLHFLDDDHDLDQYSPKENMKFKKSDEAGPSQKLPFNRGVKQKVSEIRRILNDIFFDFTEAQNDNLYDIEEVYHTAVHTQHSLEEALRISERWTNVITEECMRLNVKMVDE